MKPIIQTYLFVSLLSLAGASIPGIATADAHKEPLPDTLRTAIAWHDKARDGNEEATQKAIDGFESYLEQDSKNAKAWAYLGSAYTMLGRDAASVVNKMRYANRGLRHLDRALEIAPRDFGVRLIRSNVNWSLPQMFNRRKAATEDLLTLDELYWEELIDRNRASPELEHWQALLDQTSVDAAGEGLEKLLDQISTDPMIDDWEKNSAPTSAHSMIEVYERLQDLIPNDSIRWRKLEARENMIKKLAGG